MRKIYFLFALLAFSFVSAQESFPFMRPGLLKGKDVKIVDGYSTEKDGYFMGFYSDDQLLKVYMPSKESTRFSDRKELIGKEFNVVNVDTITEEYLGNKKSTRITLQDKAGGKLYYQYNPKNSFDYPFEVIGGLTLPADFYCDYLKYDDLGGATTSVFVGQGCQVLKTTMDEQTTYNVMFNFFSKTKTKDIDKVAVLLEDGTRLIFNTTCYPFPNSTTDFKYSFSILVYGKNLAAIKKSKIVSVKAAEAMWQFDGKKLKGIINCMETMK